MEESRKIARKMLKGRTCYGHLGGTLGERLFQQLVALGWFEPEEGKTTVYKVTPLGEEKLAALGVDVHERERTLRK